MAVPAKTPAAGAPLYLKVSPRSDPALTTIMKGILMKQTHETIVATLLRLLAKEMNATAYEMRCLGTKEAKKHAKELDGAAKIARGWAREIKASND